MSAPVLRPYQQEAVDSVFNYFASNDGNPLVVLPTGAGKSLTMASFIRTALEQYSGTRIIVLTHVKELIKQDAQAILRYWPQAPVGIWSAGLGRKVKQQITVAGIQSIHRLPATFGGTDLLLIDEAHLLSKNSDTMYGRFIEGLRRYNDSLKVIGLTATPYRTDSGLLIEGDKRIFTDICYEIDVGTLIREGFLCPLVTRGSEHKADLSGVHVRGGEFVPGELEAAHNKDHLINGALDDFARKASDRQHVLGFCSGVNHAKRCAELAQARGWKADYVTGDMGPVERDAKLEAFQRGDLRFLFNAQILTTGYDAPHIDCIMLLTDTKSPGKYVQILGRGLRLHSCKSDCLVLDFGTNVERFGPIDQLRVRSKREGGGLGVAPVKECPNCQAHVATSVLICPECEHEFPPPEKVKHNTEASEGVLIAALAEPLVRTVDAVEYERHEKFGKPPTVKVTYRCGISEFHEWLPIEDPRGNVKKHAVAWFWKRGQMCPPTVDKAIELFASNKVPAPDAITVKPDGKYWMIVKADMGSQRLDVSTVRRPLFAGAF